MIEDEMHLVGADREELEADVAAHPFLIGISAHHIRLLADCAMRSQFAAGQVIFQKGEPANRFYLIQRGRVTLESSTGDDVVRIDEVGAGDLLGWSWIFSTLHVAFRCARNRTNDGHFFVWNNAPRVLRERSCLGL
jgi:CRP-like cAMP-binding protein